MKVGIHTNQVSKTFECENGIARYNDETFTYDVVAQVIASIIANQDEICDLEIGSLLIPIGKYENVGRLLRDQLALTHKPIALYETLHGEEERVWTRYGNVFYHADCKLGFVAFMTRLGAFLTNGLDNESFTYVLKRPEVNMEVKLDHGIIANQESLQAALDAIDEIIAL